MTGLNEQDTINLKAIANATAINSLLYFVPAVVAGLVSLGYVEGNSAYVDPTDASKIAYRATPAGMNVVSTAAVASVEAAAPAAAPKPVSVYQIVDGFAPPAKPSRRGGGSPKVYPFEALEIGQAIWVPATEAKPDPRKSLTSTLSSANKRFAEFNPRRVFKAYRATKGQVFGSLTAPADGAYIFRIEPVDKPAAAPVA